MSLDGRTVKAHRMSWTLEHGEVPEGLCVLHKCDNPPCVNPEHLFLGTKADNVTDMYDKERDVHVRGERHWSHLRPESLARGNQHGMRLHPESRASGEKNGSAKLTEEKVRRIFRLRSEGWVQKRIGKEVGISQTHVARILSQKYWSHIGLDMSPSSPERRKP